MFKKLWALFVPFVPSVGSVGQPAFEPTLPAPLEHTAGWVTSVFEPPPPGDRSRASAMRERSCWPTTQAPRTEGDSDWWLAQ